EDPHTRDFDCQFPDYPGTVSWKIGFQLIRDAPVGPHGEELTLKQQAKQQHACIKADAESIASGHTPRQLNCRRRFDAARRHFFHYGLYAHARGMPKAFDPDNPKNTKSPGFHVPSSSSGKADVPGGDFMVTLGLWPMETSDPTVFPYGASEFVRAS